MSMTCDCKRCDGTGLVHNSSPVRGTCPLCKGTGTRVAAPVAPEGRDDPYRTPLAKELHEAIMEGRRTCERALAVLAEQPATTPVVQQGEREAFMRVCEALGIEATACAYLDAARLMAELVAARAAIAASAGQGIIELTTQPIHVEFDSSAANYRLEILEALIEAGAPLTHDDGQLMSPVDQIRWLAKTPQPQQGATNGTIDGGNSACNHVYVKMDEKPSTHLWTLGNRCYLGATQSQAVNAGEIVAWCEKDGDEWVVYDADSDTGQHILHYQKEHHGVDVFPIRATKGASNG